jgi:hypothetical protein
MPQSWSSELAGALQRDRQRLMIAFVELRAQLRRTVADEFEGGEAERSRVLEETERDYVALVAAGAEAARLEAALALADRRATDRESDLAAVVITQMRELVVAVAARLPA